MKTLLKTRRNVTAYVQRVKGWWGIGEKPQSKQNIKPGWFPSHPPSMLWRVDCFLVPGSGQKNKPRYSLQGVDCNPYLTQPLYCDLIGCPISLIRGKDAVNTDLNQRIWLADQLKSSKSIRNNLWLVNQSGIFFPRGILSFLFFLGTEQIRCSQDHTFNYRSPVVVSHFGRTCLILTRIWSGAPRHWLFPSASGGLPPRLLLPLGGLNSSPGAWGAPNKGNADGAVGIFGKHRTRVGYGPATGPTLKRPCAILAR